MNKTIGALGAFGLLILFGLVSCDSGKVSDSNPRSVSSTAKHPNKPNYPARLSDARNLKENKEASEPILKEPKPLPLWSPLPLVPAAGRIMDIAWDPADGKLIYAVADNGGLWRTRDLGLSWTNISDNIPDTPSRLVTIIAAHPTRSGTLYSYSGTSRHLYKSIDYGENWTLLSKTVPAHYFARLIIALHNDDVILCATLFGSGIYISWDEGAHWKVIRDPSPGEHYGEIAFHPTDSNTFYAGTEYGVYRSTNAAQPGGLELKKIYTFPGPSDGMGVTGHPSGITVSAQHPDWVWVGSGSKEMAGHPQKTGMYKSTDRGENWTVVQNMNAGIGPQTPIFGGNTSGGGCWALIFQASPHDANHIITGGYGIGETTDGGQSWENLSPGTHLNAQFPDGSIKKQPYTHHNFDQHRALFHPSRRFSTRAIRGCDTGLFLRDPSMENFHQWTNISGNMNAFLFGGLAVNEFGDRYIIANTQDNNVVTHQYGAWELKDRGYEGSTCWINPYTNISYYPYVSDLRPSPEAVIKQDERKQSPDAEDPGFLATTPTHSFLWQSYARPLSAASYTNPNEIYFKYYGNFGVENPNPKGVWPKWIYKSDDRGSEFSKFPSPFVDDPDYVNHDPICVHVSRANPADPANPEVLTIVFKDAVAQSSNGGSSWLIKETPDKGSTCAAIHPDNPKIIWLGNHSGQVYKTIDGGDNWTSIRGSLPTVPVTEIFYHEGSPEDLYLLQRNHGVYYRGKDDKDWTLWMEGRTMRNFTDIAIDYPNQKLVAASYGNALWERSFPKPFDRFLSSVRIEQVGSCEGRFQTYRVRNPYFTPGFYNYTWTKNGKPIGIRSEYLVTDQVGAGDKIRCEVNPRNFESLKKTSDPITVRYPCSVLFPQSWGNALEVEHVIGPTSLGYYDVATASQDFTIECWLSPTSYGTILANRRASEHDAKGWILFMDEKTLSLRYASKRLSEDSNSAIISSSHPIGLKNWIHLAISFQRDDKVKLYVNGDMVADAEIVEEAKFSLNSLFDLSVFSDAFGFGRMSGTMDELRIWSEARTSQQIKDNLNKTLGQISQADQQSIVAHFPFDERLPSEVQETFTKQTIRLGASRSRMAPSTVPRRRKHIEVFELSLDRSDLNESLTGATALTSAGFLNGTVFKNPLLASGQIGGGLLLNGKDQYISVPAMNLDSNQVTLSAWIRRQGDQKSNTGIIFSRDGTTVAGLRFGENNQLGYAWGDVEWSCDLVPAENQWCFVVLAIRPESASIYLNGKERNHSAAHTSQMFDGVTCIGQDAAGSRFFRGEIDQPTVWDGALPSGEIQAEYNTVHDRLSEKKVHFSLDPVDIKGTRILNRLDDSGKLYGIAHNDPSSLTLGQVGGALRLDGVDDYLSIPSLNLNTNTLTFSAWIRPDKIQNAGTGIIFNRSNSGGIGLNFLNNNELSYSWGMDQGWASGQSVPTGIWSHVALVIQRNRATVYLNGVGKSRSRVNVSEFISTITRIASDSKGKDRYFAGGIDEVAIWNRSLGSNEIYSMYRNGRLRRQILRYTMNPSDVSLNKVKNVSEYAELYAKLIGEPVFVDGQINQALQFAPGKLYGMIPSMVLNTNTLTITGWIKRHGPQPNYAGIVYNRQVGTVAGINLIGNSELSYTWGGHYGWSTGLSLPDEEWAFFALVVQPDQAVIYLNGNKKTHRHNHEILGFIGESAIGRDGVGREINADLDEIQIWNRALQESEINAIYQSSIIDQK